MFAITFTLSEPVAEMANGAFEIVSDWTRRLLVGIGTPELLVGFLVDGIVAGVGAVLEFAPPIFSPVLSNICPGDVGYMARAELSCLTA